MRNSASAPVRAAVISLLVLSAACARSRSGTPKAEPAAIALTGVTVVDVESGRLLPDRTVLVRGNRIVDVRPTERALPPAATIVDGRGKYLIPGLWDMHVHSATSARVDFPLYLAHGVTGVRNLHTSVDTALELTGALRRQVAAGTLLGPRFIANGAIVDGVRSQPGSIPIGTPEAATRVVDSLARGGADFIKTYNVLSRDTYFAVIAAAKARGLAVVGHIPATVTAEEAAAAGQRSVEHLDGMDFACSTRRDSIRADFLAKPSREAWKRRGDGLTETWSAAECADAVAAYARYGTWQVPTLAVAWAEARGDSVLQDVAAMSSLPAAVAARWRRMAEGMTDARDLHAPARFDQAVAGTRLLHAAGVPLLAGTDAGNPFVVAGHALHHELALLVEAGLSPLAALQAATLNPARFLGATDSLGTVAAGKVADLVLLDADPLADIRNTRRIRAVIVNGRYFDRAALDEMLAAQAGAGDAIDSIVREHVTRRQVPGLSLAIVMEGQAPRISHYGSRMWSLAWRSPTRPRSPSPR
ncbi:MAG: amidohydrolase family protein [Gemmatimonadaceae bacterium]